MEKTYWKRSRYESPQVVLENLEMFSVLLTKDYHTPYMLEGFFRKRPDPFIRIDKVCAELGISSKFYLDVMFSRPVGAKGRTEFNPPYLNFLGSQSGERVFLDRLEVYQKQLGALDDVGEYVVSKSIANLENWFGNSFVDGYWLFHRIWEAKEPLCSTDLFLIFEDSPEFTNMFIVTHPLWRSFSFQNVNTHFAEGLKKRCADELGILRVRFMERGFARARLVCRTKAQNYLEMRRDERWDAIWKILG